MKSGLLLLVVGHLFIANKAGAWALHYLVTDQALSTYSDQDFLGSKVRVEPLGEFLKEQAKPLELLFAEYYNWLSKKGSLRFLPQKFPPADPSVSNFLKAARLSPQSQFFYVQGPVRAPSQSAKRLYRLNELAPKEKEEKNVLVTFEAVSGDVPARSVLTTYSDEPDWMIDYGLWDHPEFGYGKRPFGSPSDPGNGAAFHMQFSHEGFLNRKVMPEILTDLSNERIGLFQRLSRLAFRTQHPYWGARFAAWSLHYLQDLSQPYHSSAAPFAGVWFLLKAALFPSRHQMIADATQLLANRHYLYEDFVKMILQESNRGLSEQAKPIIASLRNSTGDLSPPFAQGTITEFVDHVGKTAAQSAQKLDVAVVKTYGPHMTEDPSYVQDKDPNYDLMEIYSRPLVTLEPLLGVAQSNLQLTGSLTRSLLRHCRQDLP